MARSNITSTTNDINEDGGSVLFSLIKGEQLEFPISLPFITDVYQEPYEFEAVVVEALNTGLGEVPTTVKSGGVQTTLERRVLSHSGTWNATNSYSRDDYVSHGGLSYRRLRGSLVVTAVEPQDDSDWDLFEPNTIYVRVPSSLISTWTIQPSVDTPVYGFFELRVSEPAAEEFPRTWKPVRGLIKLHFSPTDTVAD
jgi:hypothetical protein